MLKLVILPVVWLGYTPDKRQGRNTCSIADSGLRAYNCPGMLRHCIGALCQ
jgi:hypothetical protein